MAFDIDCKWDNQLRLISCHPERSEGSQVDSSATPQNDKGGTMEHIVKRKGHRERFDERKIYASVYSACMTLRMSDEEAELIAQMVSKEVEEEYKDVHEVSAHSIHAFVTRALKKYNKDAAYMYDTHKDIS